MAVPQRFFKIRHKKSGLYNKGDRMLDELVDGTGQCWSKSGKMWAGTGPLRNHLNGVLTCHGDISDWEVIEVKLVEVETKTATDWVDIIKILKRK